MSLTPRAAHHAVPARTAPNARGLLTLTHALAATQPTCLQGLVGLGSVSDYVAHHAPCTGEQHASAVQTRGLVEKMSSGAAEPACAPAQWQAASGGGFAVWFTRVIAPAHPCCLVAPPACLLHHAHAAASLGSLCLQCSSTALPELLSARTRDEASRLLQRCSPRGPSGSPASPPGPACMPSQPTTAPSFRMTSPR